MAQNLPGSARTGTDMDIKVGMRKGFAVCKQIFFYFYTNKKDTAMGKEKSPTKEKKKEPTKSLKEKRAAKQEKKAAKK